VPPPDALCEHLSVHKAKTVGVPPVRRSQYKRTTVELADRLRSGPMARDQHPTKLSAAGTVPILPAAITRRSGCQSRLEKSLQVDFEVAEVLFPETVKLEGLKPAVSGPHRE